MTTTPQLPEKDLYLAVTYTEHPAKGEKTHTKNWSKTGKWEVFETPMITDRVRKRHWTECNIIINITKMKVEKNNTQTSNEDVLVKLLDRYSENIAKFIAMYYPEIVDGYVKKLQTANETTTKEISEETSNLSEKTA